MITGTWLTVKVLKLPEMDSFSIATLDPKFVQPQLSLPSSGLLDGEVYLVSGIDILA